MINGTAEEIKEKLSHYCGVLVGPGARLTLLLYVNDAVVLSETGSRRLPADGGGSACLIRWRHGGASTSTTPSAA